MSPERPYKPEYERRQEQFGFTSTEILWDRISDKHLETLLRDEATTIHDIGVNSNSFGEFLFLSVSRPVEASRLSITFFGLGYHEGRDRWLQEEWFWYENHNRAQELSEPKRSLEEVEAILKERREYVQQAAGEHHQSSRGQVFDIIADLTDEDGAMAEMEDLGEWFDDLDFDEG